MWVGAGKDKGGETSRGPEKAERRPEPQGRATGMERRHACGKHFRDKTSRILETDCMRGEVSGFSGPRYWANNSVTNRKSHGKTGFGRNQEFALEMTLVEKSELCL